MCAGFFSRLGKVFAEIRDDKKVLWFLAAFFFYIDGVYTIIEMATSYGKDVGISDTSLLMALLLTQVVAFPCAILFGKLTQRFASSKLISVCIGAYFVVAVYALWLDAAWKFWMMATFVGVFQGAIQALSRSYYAKIIPKEKSTEYFGIFDIFGKGASFMGTMLMGITTQLFDTSRAGVGSDRRHVCCGIYLLSDATPVHGGGDVTERCDGRRSGFCQRMILKRKRSE